MRFQSLTVAWHCHFRPLTWFYTFDRQLSTDALSCHCRRWCSYGRLPCHWIFLYCSPLVAWAPRTGFQWEALCQPPMWHMSSLGESVVALCGGGDGPSVAHVWPFGCSPRHDTCQCRPRPEAFVRSVGFGVAVVNANGVCCCL